MANVCSIIGFVDFTTQLKLPEIAAVLSSELFAGIPFGGEGTGRWDETPCVGLLRSFMGLGAIWGAVKLVAIHWS